MSSAKQYWCIKPIEFNPTAFPWLVEKYPLYVLSADHELLRADRDAARRLIDTQARIGENLEAERDALAAECQRLRERARTAEREAAQALRTLKGLEKVAKVVDANSDEVCAENNALRADNKRLRDLLRQLWDVSSNGWKTKIDAALAAPVAEPVMWVNPNVIGADQKINWPTAITFSNRGPCHGWTFPLYAEPQHDAELVELHGLRPVLAMILNALDRDAAEGKASRGEIAEELRAKLASLKGKS